MGIIQIKPTKYRFFGSIAEGWPDFNMYAVIYATTKTKQSSTTSTILKKRWCFFIICFLLEHLVSIRECRQGIRRICSFTDLLKACFHNSNSVSTIVLITSRILYFDRQPRLLYALLGFARLTIISEGRKREGSLITCSVQSRLR
jgi:hypothetical protein